MMTDLIVILQRMKNYGRFSVNEAERIWWKVFGDSSQENKE